MHVSLAEAKERFGDRRQAAPLELAGQWVAWDDARQQIIAHSAEFAAARAAAIRTGCRNPLMQFVLGRVFLGGPRIA